MGSQEGVRERLRAPFHRRTPHNKKLPIRHELKEMPVSKPHLEHTSRCPPSEARFWPFSESLAGTAQSKGESARIQDLVASGMDWLLTAMREPVCARI